jgi:hypothetical protein
MCLGACFPLSRDLHEGWNLVSLTLHTPVSVDQYLDENLRGGDVVKIWTFDTRWKKYEYGLIEPNPDQYFTKFIPTRGYWFFMNAPGKLMLDEGVRSHGILVPHNGWFLGSFNQGHSLSISLDVLTATNLGKDHVPQNIGKIWEFTSQWKSYSYDQPGLTLFKPGYAYWFLAQDYGKYTIPPFLSLTPEGALSPKAVAAVAPPIEVFQAPLTSTNFSLRGLRNQRVTLRLKQ